MNAQKIKYSIIILFVAFNLINAQILKPGDGIRVSLLNISENISGDYFIQDNGNIQLPYLGLVNAQNQDFNDLRNQIISEYSVIYKNPELSIQPLYRINIIGEVGNPGVYYLSGFETISDLLALAGGETSDSDIEDLVIIRNDNQLEVDMESFLNGKNVLADIGIESGDKVYVPRKWLVDARNASVLISGVTVLVAIASLFTR
ncbi:MAG: polysaccharide biosynthesis/export family protein [Ignavibacteriae bacterium]|nr:polysaccharide biosynthesis/export family protein [Ignavibacteriota bacterium]MCB9211401.1 polysaccharide biosynthesis/export family protein [Ignavibacteriales bacterium]MCB9219794.1 polysaccharide biosynthesis/export family protein [Ignavibacteriales bacterium]